MEQIAVAVFVGINALFGIFLSGDNVTVGKNFLTVEKQAEPTAEDSRESGDNHILGTESEAAGAFFLGDAEPSYIIRHDGIFYNDFFKGILPFKVADRATFEVVEDYGHNCSFGPYAKDKNAVFLEMIALSGVDTDSFQVVGSRYSKDVEHVYYESLTSGNSLKILEEIDPTSFRLLDQATTTTCAGAERVFARDNVHLITQGSIVNSADPNTFHYLNSYYFKDKNYVFLTPAASTPAGYVGNSIIKDADPLTFELITPQVARDKYRVYVYGEGFEHSEFRILHAEPPSFVPINLSAFKDQHNVFFYVGRNLEVLDKADPGTFVQIDKTTYYKDKNRVYLSGYGKHGSSWINLIPDSDPESFSVLRNGYKSSLAKDKFHVYWNTMIIGGADPQTARIINEIPDLLIDKQHLFIFDANGPRIVDGVDVATFQIEGDIYKTETSEFCGYQAINAYDKKKRYMLLLGDDEYCFTTVQIR